MKIQHILSPLYRKSVSIGGPLLLPYKITAAIKYMWHIDKPSLRTRFHCHRLPCTSTRGGFTFNTKSSQYPTGHIFYNLHVTFTTIRGSNLPLS